MPALGTRAEPRLSLLVQSAATPARAIGMSSHSARGEDERRRRRRRVPRERDRRRRDGTTTVEVTAGESGSVHRWLKLPRWMYKGGLGSREPERPESARSRTHVDIRYHAWHWSRQDSGSATPTARSRTGKIARQRPRSKSTFAVLIPATMRVVSAMRGKILTTLNSHLTSIAHNLRVKSRIRGNCVLLVQNIPTMCYLILCNNTE